MKKENLKYLSDLNNINIFEIDLNANLNKDFKRVIVLGKFNSLHLGHQKILKSASDFAKKNNFELIVMLYPDFDGFTQQPIKNVLPFEIRLKNLQFYDTKHVMVFEPNVKNYRISREVFLKYLVDNLNVVKIFVGENFSFGKPDSFKDFEIIREFVDLEVVKLEKYGNQVISTHLLESMLLEGSVDDFKKITNYNFFYIGTVIRGKNLANKYGIPTANVLLKYHHFIPYNGIYFSYFIIDNVKYPSITSISFNPTFDEKTISFETHILNFDKPIYNKEVMVELIEFYREAIKFSSVDGLFLKMKDDINVAYKYFNKKK